jgi:uncharacterized damage-inducible protein DinB
MDTLVRHFQIQARANRLMNHRLHQALLQLTPEEFMAPRVNFFPSLWATLNHILIVDWFYVDALEAGGRGQSVFTSETPCATMAELGAEQATVDARLISFCDALVASDLARLAYCDRGAQGMIPDRIDRMLPHLLMHQTHHRGQVHAMLSSTRVKPPQLDEFLMASDARFRVADMAALSMTEADLMP